MTTGRKRGRPAWPVDRSRRAVEGRAAAALLSEVDTSSAPPCSQVPHLFDPLSSSERVWEGVPRWLEAERLCLQCPLLPACEAVADGLEGVAAGRLYGIGRVPDGTPPSALPPRLTRPPNTHENRRAG